MFSIGDFKTYGSKWVQKLKIEDTLATEEKDKLFPKMVACEVKRWGASGRGADLSHLDTQFITLKKELINS